MISSTSSSDRAAPAGLVGATSPGGARAVAPRPDSISTAGAAFLRAELIRQPEIRPEVVARARELAADPSYPPPEVLRRVAQAIVDSPDCSADES